MNTHQNQPYLQNLSTQSVHMLSDTIIIGRHQDCNLVLKSERGASRKHARITIQNGNAVIMDLGSLNGTLVNGREISRAVQLADGDIVIFDEQEYRFTGSVANPLSGSDNVTVIANKDEIGRPDRIKPAIRLVETTPAPLIGQANEAQANEASLDETKAWDSLANKLDQTQSAEEQDTGQREPIASQTKAEYEKQQRELLTQKLQTQPPQMREPQAQGTQSQESQTPTPPIQPAQAQNPYEQKAYDPESQAQDRQPPTRIQPSQDLDAFEWHPDKPRSVKLPAQQPVNRQQPYQVAPQQAHWPQSEHPAAQRANVYDDQDDYESFPATSRPGGGNARRIEDAPYSAPERSTRPGLQKHSYKPMPKKSNNSSSWLIAIIFILVAVVLAYSAGFIAGNTDISGSSSGFS